MIQQQLVEWLTDSNTSMGVLGAASLRTVTQDKT